jgi:predicted amidophosphoribosyltransferase
MGDPACYRELCPECDAQVTIVDEACPECGHPLSIK